ncbi:hypothetical protein LZ30DRAFT_467470 [Colletotrichum cereale]|nr:hypothetical protein LZ30DRAFT_467470 [Colletotrichum cereale]
MLTRCCWAAGLPWWIPEFQIFLFFPGSRAIQGAHACSLPMVPSNPIACARSESRFLPSWLAYLSTESPLAEAPPSDATRCSEQRRPIFIVPVSGNRPPVYKGSHTAESYQSHQFLPKNLEYPDTLKQRVTHPFRLGMRGDTLTRKQSCARHRTECVSASGRARRSISVANFRGLLESGTFSQGKSLAVAKSPRFVGETSANQAARTACPEILGPKIIKSTGSLL